MKSNILTFLVICLTIVAYSQNNFDKNWDRVIKLEKEGLTKEAMAVVNCIFDQAKEQRNDAHLIKALIYKSKYSQILEEDSLLKIVNQFKAEIEEAESEVTQRLLENMLASLYWQYFKQNRYRFYERSTTSQKISEDFRTWDLQTLITEIHIYYQRSLENTILLQQENLEDYKVLLSEQKNSKKIRPTLYDLLCHNALEFYRTDETSIAQPAYKFTLDDPKYLSDSEDFINLKIESKDSLSLQLNALKIYQNLLKFHRNSYPSQAFVKADIERLIFGLNLAVFSNKEDAFLKALSDKVNTLKESELSALYQYEIGALFYRQGNRYNHLDYLDEISERNQWKLEKAHSLCVEVISKHPNSEGAKRCKYLMQQIMQPSLNLQSEEFLPINMPSKILVTYKNLEKLQFKIYKVTNRQFLEFKSLYRSAEQSLFFKNLQANYTFESNLKSEGDFQIHSTEIIMPSLPNGLYLIKADTQTKEKAFATSYVQATDIAVIQSTEPTKYTYQIINRLNGNPLSRAKAIFNYKNRQNKILTKTQQSNSLGFVEFEKQGNSYRQVEIKIEHDGQSAFFDGYYIGRKNRQNSKMDVEYKTYLFTDRSIYRPGQIVYFKGIVTQTEDKNTTVTHEEPVKVELYDANGQRIKDLNLITNSYGSFHGEFVLPTDGLTGQFFIASKSDKLRTSSSYFSVEEYKRPKFKPEFLPILETFKINDSISVNGSATSFAGSAISDAKVVYHVRRKVQFPYWYYWRRSFYNSQDQEISFGETQTDSKGQFEINFKALPDENISKENQPIFNYEITVDITDINGETRTASTIVNVGYHAMTLQISAPQKIDKSRKESGISISTMNLNGQIVDAKGILKVYKLEAPKKVLRIRPWEAPDYQIISEEEFKKLFPHEPFKDEHLIKNWRKEKEVLNIAFDTNKDNFIPLKKLRRWNSGKYLIEAISIDRFGQEVKEIAFTEVIDSNSNTVTDNQLFVASLDEFIYSPGDMAKLTIGSAGKNITITVEIEKNQKIISRQLIELNNSKQTISIPVLKSDIGGFKVHCGLAFYNSYVPKSFNIRVPYPPTDLVINTKIFRDKLNPGQDETWSFKIQGPKGDKVSAELLASMYDASLDEFRPHRWQFNPINRSNYYSRIYKNGNNSFGVNDFRLFKGFRSPTGFPIQHYDQLNWFGFFFGQEWYITKRSTTGNSVIYESEMAIEDAELDEIVVSGNNKTMAFSKIRIRGNNSLDNGTNPLYIVDGEIFKGNISTIDKTTIINSKVLSAEEGVAIYGDQAKNGVIIITTTNFKKDQLIKIRKNLKETAFFYPDLQTDSEGNITFSFKSPEALTQWKLQLLAHTKTLKSKVESFSTVTQKELMVIPNTPRFLRENDKITISTKIANLTDKPLSGVANLKLEDAVTGNDITSQIIIDTSDNAKKFTVDARGNNQVSWNLTIPENIQAIQYRIVANTKDFSDGEQNVLPVLSNRMLVTETLPLWLKSSETKTLTLAKLKNNTSQTLKHHRLTLEMTSNPAWYAIQALPYLMEYPYDCSEQIFAKYYANSLAQFIINSNPRIEQVFNQWQNQDALISNLEKNQELKSILIQETPWLRDAQSESEQKKRIGLLFDFNKMSNELQSAERKLKNNQLPSGAWAWFNGGYANRYITQHIIAGFGRLKQLGASPRAENLNMVQSALTYLDAAFLQEYEDLKKLNNNIDMSQDHLSYLQLHYMYVRSFYPELKPSEDVQSVMDYYTGQIRSYWLNRSLYAKGLMALTMHRLQKPAISYKILKSLDQNSIDSEELGMYWKENTNSWYWYQAPIETQALLIEAYSEIGNTALGNNKNTEKIDNLKIWLLKHKQTNRWKTTKATSDAIYALLLQGSNWLDITETVNVNIGNSPVLPSQIDKVGIEAGTGYFKTSWTGKEISPAMADVTVSKKKDGIAWGALYWQYFEELDKITAAETALKLSKKLFLKSNTDKGEILDEITSDSQLKIGDLIRVRIELETDRQMEFIHLKDMRASGLEPINVISQYKWQDGLGYYESTKDASTNFFIDYLPKGIYVFEYDLRVNNAGLMSNGISSIQSMYAPEFSSISSGQLIQVN